MHILLRQAYQRARNASADITTARASEPAKPAPQYTPCPDAITPMPVVRFEMTEEDRIAAWVKKQKELSPQLRDWNSDSKNLSVAMIQKIVCLHFGIKRQDLLSQRRTKDIVMPRQIAMYFAKKLTLRSLPDIGRKFEGRDHATVLHAIRKIEDLIGRDEQFASRMDALEKSIVGA